MPLSIILSIAMAASAPSATGEDLSRKAVQKAGMMSMDDYPTSSVVKGEEGITVATFTIQPSGEVANCRATQSSGSAALDARACALITERFKYLPARDREGNAIAEEKSQRIRWKLPRPAQPSLDPMDMRVVMTVAPNGQVTDCTFHLNDEDLSGSEKDTFCKAATRIGFKPFADGKTRKVVNTSSSVIEILK